MNTYGLLDVFPNCDIDLFGDTISVTYGSGGDYGSSFIETDSKYILSHMIRSSKSVSLKRNKDLSITLLVSVNDDFDIRNAIDKKLTPENGDLVCAIEMCLKCVDSFDGFNYDVIYKDDDFDGSVTLHIPNNVNMNVEFSGFDLAFVSLLINICSDLEIEFDQDNSILDIIFYG